jgi:HTH-type transcriptional regulator/antitoxin HigA
MANMIKINGKMTPTINRNIYGELLAKITPKIIETELEYQEALREVERLLFAKNKTIEEDVLYDLLVMLVEKYETENNPLDKPNPSQILLHLMDARGISEVDLQDIFEAEIVTKIMANNYSFDYTEAEILGKYFKVSPNLFLGKGLFC